VIREDFSAVAAGPDEQGAEGGRDKRGQRTNPKKNAVGQAEIEPENPLQNLKTRHSGKEANGKVDDEWMEPPNEKQEFFRNGRRWRDTGNNQSGGGQACQKETKDCPYGAGGCCHEDEKIIRRRYGCA
jgi:hypothetical protein